MKITESVLRQIIREEIKKLTESPTYVGFLATPKSAAEKQAQAAVKQEFEKKEQDIESNLTSMSGEELERLKKLAQDLATQLEDLKSNPDLEESKQDEKSKLEKSQSIAEKMKNLFKDKKTGELNIPGVVINATILAPLLTMKGEPAVAAASMGIGILLDLINNALQNKIST